MSNAVNGPGGQWGYPLHWKRKVRGGQDIMRASINRTRKDTRRKRRIDTRKPPRPCLDKRIPRQASYSNRLNQAALSHLREARLLQRENSRASLHRRLLQLADRKAGGG